MAEFVRKVGRISKADLVRECNHLIKLKAEAEDKQKQQEEAAELAKELEKQLESAEKPEAKVPVAAAA